MVGEKSVALNVVRTTGVALIASELIDVIYDMRWLIAFTFVLVLVDLRFGNSESRKRGEKIRLSRLIRRTMNKFVDYLCIMLMAGFLGMALESAYGFSPTMTAGTALMLCWLCEINSIYGHYCYLHNVKQKFDIYKFFIALLKREKQSVGEALEESEINTEDNAKND